MYSPSTHTPTLLEVRTETRAEAILARGTLVAGNSRRGTTARVRFEETRERQSARGKARNSPRASYAFLARDTKNSPTKQQDAAGSKPSKVSKTLSRSRQRTRGENASRAGGSANDNRDTERITLRSCEARTEIAGDHGRIEVHDRLEETLTRRRSTRSRMPACMTRDYSSGLLRTLSRFCSASHVTDSVSKVV